MKASFDTPLEDDSKEIVVSDSGTHTLPALAPQAQVQFEGEYDKTDLGSKWLNLIPKSADDGTPGNFLLDRTYDLGTKVDVVVRKVKKFYLEDLSDEQNTEGRQPRTFPKIALAEAVGLRLDGKKGVDKVVPAAYLDLFVKLEEEHPSADFVAGGFGWTSAKIKVKKGGYRNTVLILSRDLGGFLEGNLMNGTYTLASRLAKWEKWSWFEPTLRVAGKTDPAVLETITSGFNFFEPTEADVD